MRKLSEHFAACVVATLLFIAVPATAQVLLEPRTLPATSIAAADVTTNTWAEEVFDAADYVGVGGTWTVSEADVSNKYFMVIGTTMYWNVSINTSTTTTPTELNIDIPGGFTASAAMVPVSGARITDNNVGAAGFCAVNAGGSVMRIFRVDVAAFTASTDLTNIGCQLVMEVVAP